MWIAYQVSGWWAPDAQIVALQHLRKTMAFVQEVDNNRYKSLPACTGVSEWKLAREGVMVMEV